MTVGAPSETRPPQPAAGSSRPRRRWLVTAVVGTLAGVALTGFLLAGQIRQVPHVLASVSPGWAAVAFGALAVANLARARRMADLLAPSPPLPRAYAVTCGYNLATAVLPAGLGELSLPVTLHRRDNVPAAEAASTLLVTRLLDVVGVLAIGLLSALVAPGLGAWRWPAVGLLAAGLAGFGLLVRHLDAVALRLRPAAGAGGGARARLAARLAALAAAVHAQHGRLGPRAALDTAVMWLLVAVMHVGLARAVGVHLPWAAGGLAAVIVLLLAALPLRSVAGIGLQEAGWTLVLDALGGDTGDPAAHSLAVHALTLALLVVLWVVGWAVGTGARRAAAG